MAALIFPQPKDVTWSGGDLVLAKKGGTVAVLMAGADAPMVRHAYAVLAKAVRKAGARCRKTRDLTEAKIVFEVQPGRADGMTPETYRIEVGRDRARVTAESAAAGLHAAQTLRQIVQNVNNKVVLPKGLIKDGPETPLRGIFQETTYGSSAMTLDDWKALVDEHAALKMNMLMVSLYSCWSRADHRKEFMFFPSKKYPKLVSPQEESYYSPRRKRRVRRPFLPPIFEQDFFGELIGYAKERGVTIIPYFNALGHNTLIPRMYPEVSMVDADGKPKEECFCTSTPKTYTLLFGLFDEIIERYMKPHGLDVFSVGMDEVRARCECPKCRKAKNTSMDNFMVRHLHKLLGHLKKRGIKRVVMWHDMLERSGCLNEHFVADLKRRGFDDLLTVAWWSYGDQRGGREMGGMSMYRFTNFRPDLGLNTWAVPSAGWNFSQPLALSREENIASIVTHAQIVQRDGAQGMSSYSCYDPIFLEGLVALSEYSWNPGANNELRAFRERYYRMVFGDEWESGRDCMNTMMRAFAPWQSFFQQLYSRVYMHMKPGAVIGPLARVAEFAEREPYARSIDGVRRAGDGLRDLAKRHAAHRDVVLMYASDCDFIGGTLKIALGTLEVQGAYVRARKEPWSTELADRFTRAVAAYDDCIAALLEAMAAVEKARHPANAPSTLNRMTGLYDFALGYKAQCKRLVREMRKGPRAVLPLFHYTLDAFFGDDIGVKPW